MTASKKGSRLQQMAGARLMDVDPVRMEAIDIRLLDAMKRGKLKLALQLVKRRVPSASALATLISMLSKK
jgi:hypothetical protein